MKKTELIEMVDIVFNDDKTTLNESVINKQLFAALASLGDKHIPKAVVKLEKTNKAPLSKTQANKITKAQKLLDQVYTLLHGVLE